MLLCKNASPVDPELLILRGSRNFYFLVKYTDFYMLKILHLAMSIKANMLNFFVKFALNISAPFSCMLILYYFFTHSSCSSSSLLMILTPTEELRPHFPVCSLLWHWDALIQLFVEHYNCMFNKAIQFLRVQTWTHGSPYISSTLPISPFF